jgi:hypothetical protein
MTASLQEPGVSGTSPGARPHRRDIMPETRQGWWMVVAILGIAFVVRAAYAILTRHSYHPVTDAANFDMIANSLAHGHGFGQAVVPPATGSSAYRGPVYPLVLSVPYLLFGHSWTVGRLEQAVIGTALVLMIGVVATQLFSRRVGLVTMAIAAVYPTLILYGTSLNMEPLLALLSLSAVAAALQHRRAPHGLRWPLVAGVLVGLALDTRELGAVVILPVLWLLWTARSASASASASAPADRGSSHRWSRRALAAPAAALVIMVVVLVPWTARNEVALHAFVPLSTSTGYTLAGTYNPTSSSDPRFPTIWRPPTDDPALAKRLASRPHPSEVWVNSQLEHATVTYIKDHPLYVFRASFYNVVSLFDLDRGHVSQYMAPFIPYSLRLVRLAVLSSYVMYILAAIAVFLPRTRRSPLAVWAVPVQVVVLLAVVSGNIRYRASIEPYLVLLAGVTVATFLDRRGWLRLEAEPAATIP